MNGYIAFGPGGKTAEVYAATSLDAWKKAVALFKVTEKNAWKVHVVLAEKDGKPVTHLPLF